MSTEVLPLGERCNLECPYCYQEPIRTAGNEGHPKYDMTKMKATLLKQGNPFSLFGGEPLLTPIRDLEELFKFGADNFAEVAKQRGASINGIQTNGTLITDAHIELFRRYNVSVGISIDGPEELNDGRWAGDVPKTREATAASQGALERLLALGHPVSIIVTLHRLNGAPDKLPRLLEWLVDLSAKGLKYVNVHLLEVDMPGVRENLVLSSEQNVKALLAIGRLMATTPLQVMPLTDMMRLLKGEGETTCTWNSCDPYTTAAVQGVDGQGNLGNCGRTCKQGPHWLKADQPGFERYLALYHMPQSIGGCSGCRFFAMCKGHCPGEGEHEGDWRSKTEHCATLMTIFEALEAHMLEDGQMPLSLSPQRVVAEAAYLEAWQQGRNLTLPEALKSKWSRTREQCRADGIHHDGNCDRCGYGYDRYEMNTPHLDTPHVDHDDAVKPHVTHVDHTDKGGPWARL